MKTTANQRRARVMAAAAGLTLLLAACGGADQGTQEPGAEGGGASYNEADITFLQNMIGHHEQAIEMAQMVEEATDRPELNELAGNIISSQTDEIEEIRGMLEEAGEDESGMAPHGGMDGSMGMSPEEMEELATLRGAEFDDMFSDMMIRHHSSAIEMANGVLDDGENEDVATLAQGIIDEQQAEIEDLEKWREQWGFAS